MSIKFQTDPEVQKSVALLSTTEVGLGSLLHAFHFPFAGHVLSLNQGIVFLMLLKKETNRREASGKINAVSVSSSLMKSLSPAGKKLTPMLAITAQGFLFSFGITLFGINLFGVLLGMLLLSLWGFLQPLMIAYVLFGKNFFEAVIKLWTEFCQAFSIPVEYGFWILLLSVLIKCVVASGITFLMWQPNEQIETKYVAWLEKFKMKSPKKAQFNFWLIFSFAVSIGYFILSGQINAEGVWAFILRPLAVSLLFWMLAPFVKTYFLAERRIRTS